MSRSTPEICPRGHSDQIQSVRGVMRSGNERLSSLLKPPIEPSTSDPRYKEEQIHPTQTLITPTLWGYILTTYWKNDRNIFFKLIFIAILISPILLLVGFDLLLNNLMGVGIGFIVAGIIGLISFISIAIESASAMHLQNIDYIDMEAKNRKIREENNQIPERNRQKREAFRIAHLKWEKKRDVWENQLFYCHKHDIIFILGNPQLEIQPEDMNKYLDQLTQ